MTVTNIISFIYFLQKMTANLEKGLSVSFKCHIIYHSTKWYWFIIDQSIVLVNSFSYQTFRSNSFDLSLKVLWNSIILITKFGELAYSS